MRPKGARRAFTLIEVTLALTIFAMVSAAVVAMLGAAASVNSALNTSMTASWEMESALHRMSQYLRMCTSQSVPTGVSGGTAFSLVTQPDAANGNMRYAVSYATVTAADGTMQLVETDSRFGASVLVHGVTAFDVRYKTAAAPYELIISITAGKGPAMSRILRVTPRN